MKKSMRSILVCFIGLLLTAFVAPSFIHAGEPVVKEWKAPTLIFLTGPYAGIGKQIQWSISEAVKEINEAGGIAGKPLVVEWHDTGFDPAKAAAEAAKVVKDSLVIFGPIGAGPTKGAMPLVVRNDAFAMPISSGTEVVSQFFPNAVHFSEKFENVIWHPLDEWIKRNPDMKKVAQFVFAIDSTFLNIIDVQAEIMKAHGIEVLPTVELGEGVDITSAVVKAMAEKPDGFTIVTLPMQAANIVKELDKRGVADKSKIFAFPVVDDGAFYDLGKSYVDGVYIWHFQNSLSESPRWKSLLAKFHEAFPGITEPTMGIANNYDMVYMFKAAIEETGVTGDPAKLKEERKKIRDYCRNVKGFPGVQYDFDMVDGIGKTPSYLFQVEGNGKKLVAAFPPK